MIPLAFFEVAIKIYAIILILGFVYIWITSALNKQGAEKK